MKISQKMGLKEGMRSFFAELPEDSQADMLLPPLDLSSRLSGLFDYIHLFVVNQKSMLKKFSILKKHLREGGMLWVSWPKNGQLETDLSLQKVIQIGYDLGMVESTCISINSCWSALKFTYPKKGKKYNNSYGTLNKGN